MVMDMVEIEVDGKKIKLREPTFKLTTEIENETITFRDGKPVLKVGVGHYKKVKLLKYIEEIDGKKPTAEDIDRLHPKTAMRILVKIDELEGGGENPFRAESS